MSIPSTSVRTTFVIEVVSSLPSLSTRTGGLDSREGGMDIETVTILDDKSIAFHFNFLATKLTGNFFFTRFSTYSIEKKKRKAD
jgi:hypothetical protein